MWLQSEERESRARRSPRYEVADLQVGGTIEEPALAGKLRVPGFSGPTRNVRLYMTAE